MAQHTITVEADINLYTLSDANGDCIANEDNVTFEIDSDNDVIIHCLDHYFIDKADWELLEKARDLTQDDWDCIALNELLEDK
ncbi:hypothetical protein HYP06_gp104 [Vibrio phage vB_VspP_pVa5]|uniref:Uncharacterized protein n=1 Tax=Vibrio phage vB_VspP_pVa5 TaxID=1913109 RepID=A0A1J0GV78_9CAUD|nr:hypothetical protein HYP06_gp104 [Vibrio phage vB_VspP_pVa5]APC46090.1 hypothetical protein vBVspPpVa5_0069 [Vibrio phage vB_VspP_pVa5]